MRGTRITYLMISRILRGRGIQKPLLTAY